MPCHVRFTADWPMSATKIRKFRLRDRLLAEFEAEGTTGASLVPVDR